MIEKLLVCLMIVCFGTDVSGQKKPAVFALNIGALEKNRSRIMNNDPLVSAAYKLLIKDADKALLYAPVSVMEKKNDPPSGDKHDYMSLAPYFWPDSAKANGLPYIRKDGETNPEVKEYKDKEYMPKVCELVYTLGLAYYFSGDQRYSDHAANLLRVWFLDTATRMNPNLNYGQAVKGHNDGRGAGLIDTRHFVKLIDGIGLLQGAASWKKKDQQGMKKWFSDFLHWMQTSKNGLDEMNAANNHGVWYDAQRLSMALFIDSADLANKVVKNALSRLDKQIDDKGMLPKEMERTTSQHYTVFAMHAFFIIAQMAENTAVDVWNYTSPSGKSLKKAFDALYPYISQEKKWEGQQIKDYDYEEGYPLMLDAAGKYNCKTCAASVNRIAGDKSARLRIKLLTDIIF